MKRLTFLLADDDFDDIEFFEQKLHALSPDAALKMVTDGEQAINYLRDCKENKLPCAVILDYNMPKMNAPEVLDWLCERSQYNGIAKYVWSTAHNREYVDDCLNKGVIEYFVKPNNDRELAHIIQKILAYCG
jgi:CheY-like chemotaxis protein